MIGKTISHYKILFKLGEGGMGVVYKAEDTKLDRLVALKFLPSHLIDDEKALNRLLKEAKAASKINHPNVCTIYAIEEHEDTHFIVMEYVDGMTLRQKIKERANSHSPLRVDDAIAYSIQICKALKAAHDKGIIHRDIKSENIMINLENMAKVMDFGLAKLKDEAGLTKTGTAGTIAYMAPEQIKGEDIDNRVDIWAFGVVLFEMLTREFPFEGQYESAMSYSIVNTEPKSITDIIPDVPINIEQLIYKALEKDKERRYQEVNELIGDLKKIPSKVTILEKQEKSIVVLPFVNMSPDPEQEYFSDGLTEEIITDLSHIHTLSVISRSSAMTFKGTKKKIKEIAREVNVHYVLEGSVRKAGNKLRITAQLIDAINDKHLWAEKYSGTLDDVFDIQERVSSSIVDALKLKLNPEEEKKIAKRPIDNVQAYECYLQAKHEYWRFTAEGAKRALQHLQEALGIVGDNVFIYAGMAEAYFVLSHTKGEEFVKHLDKVEECVNKIFELESESSYGYCFLGLVKWKEPKPQEAIKFLKRACDINPDDTETLIWLSFTAAEVGKLSIAEPCIRRLLEIDPLSPMSHFCIGWFHLMEGHLEPVLEAFKKAHQMVPESPLFGFKYARALALNQQFEEAYSLFDLIIKNSPDDVFAWLGPFFKYALQGEKNKALKSVTEDIKTAARLDETVSWYMAECYALIDEKEEAIDWLENAVWRGVLNYSLLSEYDPFLENIRGEERFKKLMERVKYEWENFEV